MRQQRAMSSTKCVFGRISLWKLLACLCLFLFCTQLFFGLTFFRLGKGIKKSSPQDFKSPLSYEELEIKKRAEELQDEYDGLFCENSEYQTVEDKPAEVDRQIKKPFKEIIAESDLMGRCDQLTGEALSAYTRASTDECKESIKLTSCLLKLKPSTLFPSTVPTFCPLRDTNNCSLTIKNPELLLDNQKLSDGKGDLLGCYKDVTVNRDLSGAMSELEDNTPGRCVDLCYASGYNYAGLQYGKECHCGDAFGKHGSTESCDKPCNGDSTQICGGFNAQSIYKTGFGVRPVGEERLIAAPAILDSETSSYVRILFMLTWNGRAVRQVRRLFKSIYHVNHYYYIHVDSREEYMFREATKLAAKYHNVRVVQNRFATIWGGASLLQMLLSTMKEALQMTDWNWDFYLNLSESDYPVKSIERLTAFLSVNREKNFLKSHGPNTPQFLRKQGLLRFFYECDYHLWRIGKRQVPTGIRIDGGSDWVCLNRKFIQYVTTSQDDLVQGLNEYYKYALLPAESYFHTVLQNSAQCDTFVDNNLHKTNWNRKRGCLCQYKHIVDWCGCSPLDYTLADTEKLKGLKENQFFARKFEAIVSNSVINWLDQWVYGDYPTDLPAVANYWQNVFHFDDSITTKSDGQYTYYMAFARNTVKQLLKIKDLSPSCMVQPTSISQVHVLFKSDTFHSLLVHFQSEASDGSVVEWEGQLQRRDELHFIRPSGPVSRLKDLQIGETFDMKERYFRDFGQLITSSGEPNITVVQHWELGEAINASLAVVNPFGQIVITTHINIPRGNDNLAVTKLEIGRPAVPGQWSVQLIHMDTIVARRPFLILPNLYTNRQLNGGVEATKYSFPLEPDDDFTKHVKPQIPFTDVQFKSKGEFSEIFVDIKETMKFYDGLTSIFWEAKGVCSILASSCDIIPQCRTTTWSSFSPDPKSDIGHIDPKTGKIMRPVTNSVTKPTTNDAALL